MQVEEVEELSAEDIREIERELGIDLDEYNYFMERG